ncbi:hypothetical protein AWB82_07281 [Caballeronia glebae]|uniref:Uncharacterized protein n=1 Tax=Caballeronia glebae TaxID=1777143 RepID=A0A158DXN6_9BURK|nr:hypothetical protein AWB82_07281 [Caballeronia glebae]
MVVSRSDPPVPRPARRARLRGRSVRRGKRLFGPRSDGGIPPRDRPADGDQHDRDRLASEGARDPVAIGRHSARRSAFLDDARLGARRADVQRLGAHVGLAFEQSLRRVARDVHARRRCRAGQDHRDRYALDLAGRPASDARSAADRRRQSEGAGSAGSGRGAGYGRSGKGARAVSAARTRRTR